MSLTGTITAVQRALGVLADGKPGPETWTAIHRAVVIPSRTEAASPIISSPVDLRSEKTIDTLHDAVKPYARSLVVRAAERGITIRIISGTRTYAEQDALFAKRPQVTKARGGYSNHNFGIAFDIGIFSGAKYLPESPLYKVAGAIGIELGLDWGGSWKSFVDEPHFQLRPRWAQGMSESAMLAELRRRMAAGKDAFA